jgi:ABC-type Zn uptake system ZnuABC Zn-binding protein ZnuA
MILASLGLSGCSHEKSPWPPDSQGKPRVLVSFPPLYSFAKSVAGDDAAVRTLLTNQGPHGYDFQARDVLLLREADVFFVNGLELDDAYTERMKNSCGNTKLDYVPLGKKIPKEQLIALGKEIKHGDHVHRGYDPHVWLGIPEAIEMVGAIRDELKKVDPVHAANYEERARQTTAELTKLRDEGIAALKGKQIKVVSFHGALSYFARTFGLEVVATLQNAAERDLAPGELKDVAERCANEGVSVIAVEPQFPQSRRIAEDVARQVQSLGKPAPKIITIDPLETADAKDLDAGWYVRKMRDNIQQLADAVK